MANRDTPERRQLQQWLDSYVHLRGHEPAPYEIEEFLARNEMRGGPFPSPASERTRGRKSFAPPFTQALE